MTEIKLFINTIICLIIISCNFFLTYTSNLDDELVKKENNKNLRTALLSDNKNLRITYIFNSLLVCGMSVLLIFSKLNVTSIIFELYCIYYSINKLFNCIRLRYNATDTQRYLITYWALAIIEDIEKNNISSEEGQRILREKMTTLSKESNIRIFKINKVLKDLDEEIYKKSLKNK